MSKAKKRWISILSFLLFILIIVHIPRSFLNLSKDLKDLTWKVQYTDKFLELTTDEKQELTEILEPMLCIRKLIIIPRGGWDYALKMFNSNGDMESSFVIHSKYFSSNGKQYYYMNFDFERYNEFMEGILCEQ